MMRWVRIWIVACGVLLSLVASGARADTVTVIMPDDQPVYSLVVDILRLALSKSAPESVLRTIPETAASGQLGERLTRGEVSVEWGGAQPDNEAFLPIRIPILKGLLGYRLLMIRQGDQHRFNRVNSLGQLRTLVAGQGATWGDRFILEANRLPVRTAADHAALFAMLQQGTIDYFPRALHEPWNELEQYAELDPAVERNLLLIYPYALYFFVAQDNQALHDRIYLGLERAIEDGSFDTLFYNNSLVQTMLAQARFGKRRVLRLINPFLHPATPFYRKEFWLDPASLLGNPAARHADNGG